MKTSIALAGVASAWLLAGPAFAATNYAYDDLGRLTVVTYDNGKQIVYSYDAAGNRSAVVTQTGTNQPPVAVPDSATTNSNTAVTIHPLANDTDPDSDTLTIQSVITNAGLPGATVGTPVIGGGGTTITYTPPALFSGTDSFGYQITDGQGHTASAPVSVKVLNQAPTAVHDNATVPLGTPTVIAVLGNDTDPENDPLLVTSVTAPSHGTATINAGTTVTYATIGGNTAADSFTYYIADNHGNTAHTTVSVTVTGTNHPPVARNDELDINDTSVPVTPQGQLDPRINDTDADGDPLTITTVTQGAHGTVTIINSGTAINYTYNSTVIVQFETTDSFTYTISDGNGGTATATVNVVIYVQSGA